jgi:hypothetical protein
VRVGVIRDRAQLLINQWKRESRYGPPMGKMSQAISMLDSVIEELEEMPDGRK